MYLIVNGTCCKDEMVRIWEAADEAAQNDGIPGIVSQEQIKTVGLDGSKSLKGEGNMADIKEVLEKFKVVAEFFR